MQNIVSTLIIVFVKNLNLSLVIATILFVIMMFFSDFTLKIDPDKYLFLYLPELIILTYHFNSLIIIIYGFGRCPPGYLSKPLIEYKLNEDIIYPVFFRRFYIFYLITLLIEFSVFLIRAYKPSGNLPRIKLDNTKNDCTGTQVCYE